MQPQYHVVVLYSYIQMQPLSLYGSLYSNIWVQTLDIPCPPVFLYTDIDAVFVDTDAFLHGSVFPT